MKNVFITPSGQISFQQTPSTTHCAKMGCTDPKKYQDAADQASFNARSIKDVEGMDQNWAHKCEQSPYGGNVQYWFEDVKAL